MNRNAARPAARSTAFGVALMTCAMLLLPVGDSISKHVAMISPYSPALLAWSRFVVGVLAVLPVVVFAGYFRGLGRFFLLSQMVRGALISGAIFCMITAVSRAPVADVFGAFFIGPVVATLLARFVLREEVRPREWAAVGLGLVGVLLVLRPGLQMSEGLAWAFTGGISYGAYQAATRWTAGSAPALAQTCAQMIVGAVILAPSGLADLAAHGVVRDGGAPFWIVAAAVVSLSANLLTILAYGRARAATLAPIIYAQIIAATTVGWLAFGDFPDKVALIGLAVICSSALVLIRRRR